MAQLIAEGIYHRFGRQQVLRDVGFSASDGECVVLFGANGAGKSTLLALLSTRLCLQKGSYLLNGIQAADHGEELRAALIFIGHHTHLYGHLSPMENLAFFADLRGIDNNTEKLHQAVATVGLARFAQRPVMGFSAGMRKRLALARMLLASPSLLLLDEPYSALDFQGVAWLNQVLKDYLTQGGTIIMATHDPERVAALAPRTLRIEGGRMANAHSEANTT